MIQSQSFWKTVTELCISCPKHLLTTTPLYILGLALGAALLGIFFLVNMTRTSLPPYTPPTHPFLSLNSDILIQLFHPQTYILLILVAPIPRKPLPEEKRYRTLSKDGVITKPQQLPCWLEALELRRQRQRTAVNGNGNADDERGSLQRKTSSESRNAGDTIDEAELYMSVVVPAYNEEERLGGMLEEAVDYLEHAYGTSLRWQQEEGGAVRRRKNMTRHSSTNAHASSQTDGEEEDEEEKRKGWEIIIVSDGSKDKTEEVAFNFTRDHQLSLHPKGYAGPWTPGVHAGVHIPPGTIRVARLSKNRGKGGAVTHGMRHVRGRYVVFADADGASRFDDLGKLVNACRDVEDSAGRGVAVGSRAHMVGSEAVVNVCLLSYLTEMIENHLRMKLTTSKRSKIRNFLMHSFHLILFLLTPRKTATIKDTQCGFKLFSRASLPYIIPYMHSEGWIFDVEMLMLAEFAGIPVAEVPVTWREVKGSKLNVMRDSIGMAWGLAVLRGAWSFGVFKRSIA